jgi:hypothetical protein
VNVEPDAYVLVPASVAYVQLALFGGKPGGMAGVQARVRHTVIPP